MLITSIIGGGSSGQTDPSGQTENNEPDSSGEHAHGVAIDEQASRQKGLDASMRAALRVQDMVLQSLMFTEETVTPDSDLAVVSAATGTQSEPVPASEAAYREF